MLKKLITISIALAALMTGGQTMAETYVGGNILATKIKEDHYDSYKFASFYGRLGTEFTEHFSAEIRVGTGLDNDTISGPIRDEQDNTHEADLKVKLKHFYGAYVRGTIPVADVFYPYAVVGYTQAKWEEKATWLDHGTAESGSLSTSSGDVSFGVGADIRLTSEVDLNLEYMNYYDKHDITVDGFAVGVTYRFY